MGLLREHFERMDRFVSRFSQLFFDDKSEFTIPLNHGDSPEETKILHRRVVVPFDPFEDAATAGALLKKGGVVVYKAQTQLKIKAPRVFCRWDDDAQWAEGSYKTRLVAGVQDIVIGHLSQYATAGLLPIELFAIESPVQVQGKTWSPGEQLKVYVSVKPFVEDDKPFDPTDLEFFVEGYVEST